MSGSERQTVGGDGVWPLDIWRREEVAGIGEAQGRGVENLFKLSGMKRVYLAMIMLIVTLCGCSIKRQSHESLNEIHNEQIETDESIHLLDNSAIVRLMRLMTDSIELVWYADSVVTNEKSIYGAKMLMHAAGVDYQHDACSRKQLDKGSKSKENRVSDSISTKDTTEDRNGVTIADPPTERVQLLVVIAMCVIMVTVICVMIWLYRHQRNKIKKNTE